MVAADISDVLKQGLRREAVLAACVPHFGV